jgi:hypothetical protein
MNPNDFPIILDSLRADTRKRPLENFERALHQFNVGLEVGEIPNVRWNDAKQDINRALSDAFDAYVRPLTWGKLDEAPEAVQELVWEGAPQLHTMVSWQKRMDNFKLEHPLATAISAFLLETKPLAEAAEKLKKAIVKRAPKPLDEQKPRYSPPRASDGAIASVRSALQSITEGSYQSLRTAFVNIYTKELNRYLDEQRSSTTPAKVRDRATPPIVYKCTSLHRRADGRYEFTELDDSAGIIGEVANRDAIEIRDSFIHKNLAKLASIVDAKQNLKSVDVISHRVDLAALRGSLRLKFEDGSQFDVQNSVVWSRSINNKTFLRFPLTFHDVQLPEGIKMKQPSEEKMNTEFSGRYYGTVHAPQTDQLLLESLGLRLGRYDPAKGTFPAEATYDAKTRVAAFSGDFQADLLLRAFKPIEEMSGAELNAELRWHDWALSVGLGCEENARTVAQSRLDTLMKKAAIHDAFSATPSGSDSRLEP